MVPTEKTATWYFIGTCTTEEVADHMDLEDLETCLPRKPG